MLFKKIDKYIIRKFLGTFVFTTVLLLVIAIIIDITQRLTNFLEHDLSLKEIVMDYYIHFALFYGNMFIPVVVFVTVILFTSKLSGNSEIIAILSSGITLKRLIKPYMISAFCIALFSFLNNHMLLPLSNHERLTFDEKYFTKRKVREINHIHKQISDEEYVYVNSFKIESQSGNLFSYEVFFDNQLAYKLLADNISEKFTDSLEQQTLRLLRTKRRTVEMTSLDSALLLRGEPEYMKTVLMGNEDSITTDYTLDTILKFKVEELAPRKYIAETMNFFQLRNFIEIEKFRGSGDTNIYEIEMHKRTSLPFSTFILTIIGLSVSMRKKRAGTGVNLAVGMVLVFLYVFFMRLSDTFSIKAGFPPMIAAWSPNLIFAGIAFYMYLRVKK